MKKLAIILILAFTISCSKDDDCHGNYNQIDKQFQSQIDYIIKHPNPTYGIDYRQLDLVKKERDKRLSNACK